MTEIQRREKRDRDELRDKFAHTVLGLFTMDQASVDKLTAGAPPLHKLVAKFCYDAADAMLAERDKRVV